MEKNLQAKIASVIYDVWKHQGQPEIISGDVILEHYRQKIGDISPKRLDEEIHRMEDESSPIPFLRVGIQNTGGEMRKLGLKDIDPDRLLSLANGMA